MASGEINRALGRQGIGQQSIANALSALIHRRHRGAGVFLILSIGSGCNFTPGDRTCMGGLARADLFVSRVSVWAGDPGRIE
jgi:hypothetical protein